MRKESVECLDLRIRKVKACVQTSFRLRMNQLPRLNGFVIDMSVREVDLQFSDREKSNETIYGTLVRVVT